MNPSIIVTSISKPTAAMRALAEGCRRRGLRFYCIGDVTSPPDFSLDGCAYYSLERQSGLLFRLAAISPAKHYARKNLGYLIAMAEGAGVILETDDDNAPAEGFWKEPRREVGGRVLEGSGWANVYAYFSGRRIWPRGLPLEFLHAAPGMCETAGARECLIQQGLADGDPDVDAVFRLTRGLPVSFDRGSPVILGRGVWCPFNSQNTLWWREAFPLLYLPSHCSFRMTDIWRSFVAQRCLWEDGGSVSFHAPTVFQDRNAHDLLRDFEQEVPGYLHNARIAETLGALRLTPGSPLANLELCYDALIRMGLVGSGESGLVRAWCDDVREILA